MTLRYSLNRRARLRGRSTRQTKLKLLSTFCAIDNAVYSRSATLMLASAEPLTLSTKPTTWPESSAARGPSGARKPCSNRLEIAVEAQAPSMTANTNASSGTIASIVV